jgi:hypothetical protein
LHGKRGATPVEPGNYAENLGYWEELKDRPDQPFLLFNLGSIAIERQRWPEAGHLGRSLAGSAPGDSITRTLFA